MVLASWILYSVVAVFAARRFFAWFHAMHRRDFPELPFTDADVAFAAGLSLFVAAAWPVTFPVLLLRDFIAGPTLR